MVAVEPEKTREVDEHALCGFGTEVAFPLSSGADAGGEHEVEVEDVNRSEDFSAGGAFFVLEDFMEFFFGHGSCVRDTECFGDVVGTEEFLAVRALEHFVGEAADVAACDVDRLDADGGAFDFVVAFLYDVEVAPDVFNPAFHHCAKRTVVDESCNGAVDFGGGPDESASACKFGDSFVGVFHFCHGIQMQYVWVGKAYYSFYYCRGLTRVVLHGYVDVQCGCGISGSAQTALLCNAQGFFFGRSWGVEKSKGDCMVFSGYAGMGASNLRVTAYSSECGIFRSVPAWIRRDYAFDVLLLPHRV